MSDNDLFEALSNARRRHVIRALADGATDHDTLAREIAAAENDIPAESVTGDQRKRVYVGLYQAHLDKLDAWGIVTWDETSGTVQPGPAHEPALAALRAVTDVGHDAEAAPSLLGRVANIVQGGA